MGNHISLRRRPSPAEIIIKTALRFTILATQSKEIYNEFTLRDDINIIKHIKFINNPYFALASLQKSPRIIHPNKNFGQFSACKRIIETFNVYHQPPFHINFTILLEFVLGFQETWDTLCGAPSDDQLINLAIKIRNDSSYHIAKKTGRRTFNRMVMVDSRPVEIETWIH